MLAGALIVAQCAVLMAVVLADAAAETRLLWPMQVTVVPLTAPTRPSVLSPAVGQEAAQLGSELYRAYVEEIFPAEVGGTAEGPSERPPRNRKPDSSEANRAFRQWQVRSAAQAESPRGLLGANGSRSRSWSEFYGSRAWTELRRGVSRLAELYLRRAGRKDPLPKVRITAFCEVFKKGEFATQSGNAFSGSHVSGRYFAAGTAASMQLSIEDSRGINPPFGKTFRHFFYEGGLVFMPPWASHFLTPNLSDEPVVSFVIAVYPLGDELVCPQDELTSQLVMNI